MEMRRLTRDETSSSGRSTARKSTRTSTRYAQGNSFAGRDISARPRQPSTGAACARP